MATNIPAQVTNFLDYKAVESGISENTRESNCKMLCEFFSCIRCPSLRDAHSKNLCSVCLERARSKTGKHGLGSSQSDRNGIGDAGVPASCVKDGHHSIREKYRQRVQVVNTGIVLRVEESQG